MGQRQGDPIGGVAVDGGPAEARVIVARTQRMMATDVSAQLSVEPGRAAEAEAALAACFSWFAEVERRLSRFQPESELCALNRSAGSWFATSETLYAAVFVAIQAAFASDGLFNPALLHRLEALGYDRDFTLLSQQGEGARGPHLPASQERAEPLNAWRGVFFDSARRRIRLPRGVALDLGGIAKGWAADVALERLCQPFPGALINVGGDLRLQGGPQPGQPWTIGLRDPHAASEARAIPGAALDAPATETTTDAWNRATLAFSRGALATSGAVRRWWRKDGARYHHLLDPRTGQPLPLWTSDDAANGAPRLEDAMREPLIATVTALAPTGAQAEAATKVALARGLPDAMAAVERAWARWGAVGPQAEGDGGVALIFTLSDGRVVHSRNLDAWLATWGTAEAPLSMLLNTHGAQPLELGLQG